MAKEVISSPRARTKIVATVGPACREEAQLDALVRAGVDVFRLNMAHGQVEEHEAALVSIRRVSQKLGTPVAVLVDLAGPKIRLGELPGGQAECPQGGDVVFVRGELASRSAELVSTYDRLIDELDPGNKVMLADGTVILEVTERGADFARCRVVQPGVVRTRQGINLPGARLSLPALSDSDRQHAEWAARQGADFVSLSFVRAPDEVRELKAMLRKLRSPAKVVAKIEKQEALDRLDEIVAACDAVMVARGDLGVEMDVAYMPAAQKRIVATCNRHQKPVIIATQMLDSMQRARHPTRAEVTDVANAILDGCDACMLSGETAIGEYPLAAVAMMNRIALATEPLLRERPPRPLSNIPVAELRKVSQAVVYGVQFIAAQLDARLIVVATHSGATALALSQQRNQVPIVGVTDSAVVSRQLCLYWGVVSLEGVPTSGSDELLRHIEAWGIRDGCLAPGDFVILVSGLGLDQLGHNMVLVHQVQSQ